MAQSWIWNTGVGADMKDNVWLQKCKLGSNTLATAHDTHCPHRLTCCVAQREGAI